MLEDGDEVLIERRQITVAVTGREQDDLATRGRCCLSLLTVRSLLARKSFASCIRVITRNRCIAMYAQGFFEHIPPGLAAVGRIDGLYKDGDTGELPNRISGSQQPIPCRRALVSKPLGFCSQHQVREIDVPWMRGNVRTLGHVTHVTQVTMVYNLPEDLFRDGVDFTAGGLVNGIKQCRKRVTEIETAATAVADIEDALEFLVECFAIVKFISLPGHRMPRRGFEAALAMIGRFAHGRMQVPDATPATQ